MTYTASNAITILLDEELDLCFYTTLSSSPLGPHYEAPAIKELAYIQLLSKNKISFEKFVHLQYIFQCFFALALDDYPNVMEMFFKIELQDEPFLNKVDVYYHCYQKNDIQKRIYSLIPFTYEDIKLNPSNIISNWYKFYNKYEDVVNLYITIVINSESFVETKFLALAQVVEAYHRLRSSDTIKTKAAKKELSERLDKICKQLNDDKDKKFIKDNLWSRYEPTLDERLRELISESGNLALQILCFAPHEQMPIESEDDFIKKFKLRTRVQ